MALKFSPFGGPKIINIVGSGTSSMMYIVPKGKTFTGHIVLSTSSGININDSTLNAGTVAQVIPVNLRSGTIVKNSSGNTLLTGVEE